MLQTLPQLSVSCFMNVLSIVGQITEQNYNAYQLNDSEIVQYVSLLHKLQDVHTVRLTLSWIVLLLGSLAFIPFFFFLTPDVDFFPAIVGHNEKNLSYKLPMKEKQSLVSDDRVLHLEFGNGYTSQLALKFLLSKFKRLPKYDQLNVGWIYIWP